SNNPKHFSWQCIVSTDIPLGIPRNTQPKHFSQVRNSAPGGFSRWGGAPRSESEINDCRWQSHHKYIGSAAGASSGQCPLEAASYRFSCRSKKIAAGGNQPNGLPGPISSHTCPKFFYLKFSPQPL
ncbi:MAG: hypothetical protein SOZ90_05640, partial [Candidatus Faecousia sp.]|nr:hypothetical protein [Candidatus Faecousia sp.]